MERKELKTELPAGEMFGKYTTQNILRATLLFTKYLNVKVPKLNPYLIDIPKDAE